MLTDLINGSYTHVCTLLLTLSLVLSDLGTLTQKQLWELCFEDSAADVAGTWPRGTHDLAHISFFGMRIVAWTSQLSDPYLDMDVVRPGFASRELRGEKCLVPRKECSEEGNFMSPNQCRFLAYSL